MDSDMLRDWGDADIASDFISMACYGKPGYHISLRSALTWMGLLTDSSKFYMFAVEVRNNYLYLPKYGFTAAKYETDLGKDYWINDTNEIMFSNTGFKLFSMIYEHCPVRMNIIRYYLNTEKSHADKLLYELRN